MIKGQWTISNTLSLLRVIFLVPISILLLQNDPSERWFILIFMIITASTDMLDGVLARRLNQVTEFGKIIDPLADKAGILVVGFILMFQKIIPAWFFMMAVFRDILILTGGIYLRRKKGIILSSNIIGKWTVGLMTLYIFLAFIRIESLDALTTFFLIVSSCLVVLSFMVYVNRFIKVVRGN
jgi:CDP-diacylglycerol--glycerol-3-phosphate 3-phosphatidyltransferase